MSLALIPIGLPLRAQLVSLNEKLAVAEKRVDHLKHGRTRLQHELAKQATAESELAELEASSAERLLEKLRAGVDFAISAFSTRRQSELSDALSASRIDAGIAEKALKKVEAEIQTAERELADLRLAKQEAVMAALSEASEGFVADLATLADDLRQILAILGGLDRVTAAKTGDWTSSERIVCEIPAVGGVAETAVVVSQSALAEMERLWRSFADDLASDALSRIEDIKWPHVSGHEDRGKVTYDQLSRVERSEVDRAHAGVN